MRRDGGSVFPALASTGDPNGPFEACPLMRTLQAMRASLLASAMASTFWWAHDGFDLARQGLDALIEPAPVASQVLDDVHHAWRQDIGGRGQDARQLSTQEALPLPDGDAALQQESADLVDDASALAHQSLTHPMQRLQVELIGGLRRYELHRWPLHRLGDRLRVAEVVLLSLRIRANVLRRHQPHDQFEEGVLRHRTQRRAGMGSRGHSYRGLLPRLAGVAHAAREAR